jgi:hypothetical protein
LEAKGSNSSSEDFDKGYISITHSNTNFIYDGTNVHVQFMLTHENFRERGALHGNTNLEIYWIASDGRVRIVE